MAASQQGAYIAQGTVIHRREQPRRNAFRYPVFFLMLPMRGGFEPSRWFKRNQFGLISFYDSDHGDNHTKGLAWIEKLLAEQGIDDADGEIWLQCFPRVLGYTFKPVSFWFCHRRDGALRCIVAEVNNTFGERHVYLLDEGRPLRWGEDLQATKAFHVSPFFDVHGQYRFRFMRAPTQATQEANQERLVIRIDYEDAGQRLLHTSVSGDLRPLTACAALLSFLSNPLMTLMVVGRIHWQALRLWLKRAGFRTKPHAPLNFVTRTFSNNDS
jgi:uncharacterized protein